MQQYSLRLKSYRSWCVDDTPVSEIANERFKKLLKFWELKKEKCSLESILKVLEVSKATLYRWQKAFFDKGMIGLEPGSKAPIRTRKPKWSRQLEQRVLSLRKKYPLWGKRTITSVINRNSSDAVSQSTIGRILKKLIKLGKIKPVCFFMGRLKPKKRRVFNSHAKRWKKGMKAKKPGELLQIDHMTVNLGSTLTVKHFKATCPVSKITMANCYYNASSKTAAKFLDFIREKLPFEIESIQVDGGSEFMKDFENYCENHKIKLIVIPPRTPELNGCVERCNRTFRYEFYSLYDGLLTMTDLRLALQGYLREYNFYRPHQGLEDLTPMEYYTANFLEA